MTMQQPQTASLDVSNRGDTPAEAIAEAQAFASAAAKGHDWRYVRKDEEECLTVTLITRHNSSGYFWIAPTTYWRATGRILIDITTK